MRTSSLYNSLLEKSYFFNSRFNKMKMTVEQVVHSCNDIKSYKIISTDPVTFEFKTKGEVGQERQNQIADYIMQQQDNYYGYTISNTSNGFIMEVDVGYIEMDDSLPERHDPTVLMKALTRKVMAKMRSLNNSEPNKYRGASRARCNSDYEIFTIEFPYLDKYLAKEYSEIISDIIEYNDGEVKRVDIDGDTLKISYEDNSETITREHSLLEEVSEQEKKYNDYLNDHIGNVKSCYSDLMMIADLPEFLVKNKDRLDKIIEDHDSSKWSGEEYNAYRKHFYPDDELEELSSEGFETAWLHHYTNNPHHWEYWCILNPSTGEFELQDDIDEEEYKIYVVERICDWCAMSRHFNNRVVDWYKENQPKIVQPDFAVDFTENLLQLCNDNNIDVIKGE